MRRDCVSDYWLYDAMKVRQTKQPRKVKTVSHLWDNLLHTSHTSASRCHWGGWWWLPGWPWGNCACKPHPWQGSCLQTTEREMAWTGFFLTTDVKDISVKEKEKSWQGFLDQWSFKDGSVAQHCGGGGGRRRSFQWISHGQVLMQVAPKLNFLSGLGLVWKVTVS